MTDDPGWPAPFGARRPRRPNDSGVDRLVSMRIVFLSFSLVVLLLTVLVLLNGDRTDGDERPALSLAIVGAVGVLGLVAGRTVHRRLDCSSDEALAHSYRSRFFARLAFAEAPVLAGFAMSAVAGPWWVYFVGFAFGVAGFLTLMPSRRNLERDQRALSADGCHRSLVRALRAGDG